MSDVIAVGDLITGLEVGVVAHGGHFIARHEGQVIFVRDALTGELVDVRVTEKSKRFARADVVAVHRASPHRVVPPGTGTPRRDRVAPPDRRGAQQL